MIPGQGVLAIWNGIEAGHEEEFLQWHVAEHIPERMAVPGFLRARRYRAVRGFPDYFNFYEVLRPNVLESHAYVSRLNDPSEWTQRVVPHFTAMSRTLCEVVASGGRGVGGFIFTMRFTCASDTLKPMVPMLLASPAIAAVHLLERTRLSVQRTAEAAMRTGKDATSPSILLVEGPAPEALDAAVNEIASDVALLANGASPPTDRGLYQLEFLLDHGPADVSGAHH
ncbi:MAG: hypothetical protein M9944_08720 [Rhizobiaceae bacterium]|nr:hypothetical protein [Rhizobiaceae bacterium]